MSLFQKIYEVSENNDMEVAWEIILLFEVYIHKECYSYNLKGTDEDMVSEIMTKLPKRILRFKIKFEE